MLTLNPSSICPPFSPSLARSQGEYHRALALNPSLDAAKQGLESLERLEKAQDGAAANGDADGLLSETYYY